MRSTDHRDGLAVLHRRHDADRDPVRGHPAATDPARPGGQAGSPPARAKVTDGTALPARLPAAADDIRHRHHRHGLRHAAGAVPGHGRAHLRRAARRRCGAGAAQRRHGVRLAARRPDRRLDPRVHRQGIAILVAVVVWGFAMAAFGTTSLLWLAVMYLAIGGFADLVSRSTGRRCCRSRPPTRCAAGCRASSPSWSPAAPARRPGARRGRRRDLHHVRRRRRRLAVRGAHLVAGWFGPSLRDYDSRNPSYEEPGRVVGHSA